MKPNKVLSTVITALLILSFCFGMTIYAYGTSDPDIDYTVKTAQIQDGNLKFVDITVDGQYEAIPCPKILFWQANMCNYHGIGAGKGLTTERVVACLNAALTVADVDYYVDAYDSRTELVASHTTREYYWPKEGGVKSFTKGQQVTVNDVAQIDTTSYHVITESNLDTLVNYWKAAEASEGGGYDYLIIVYDGLVASGAPSSNNYYDYAYQTGHGISLTPEEYQERAMIAEYLKDIPTLHITAPKADGENMHLDTVPYYDQHSNKPSTTYQSYANSVGYYYWNGDCTTWSTNAKYKLTAILMLNALAYINPEYYLTLIDNDPSSPTYGQFNFTAPPTAEEFKNHMPSYHSYMSDIEQLKTEIKNFITIKNIVYADELAPGLTYSNVTMLYSEDDYDKGDDVEWIEIPSTDYTLSVTGDSSTGTTVTADIDGTNYYSKRIKMVITAEASPEFGISGEEIETNVGLATIDYFSIDGNLLYKQTVTSPTVQWEIYNVTFDMLKHGSINVPIAGVYEDASEHQYEVVKDGYSPYKIVDSADNMLNFTIEDGFYLAGFTCDQIVNVLEPSESQPDGELKIISAGEKIDISEIPSIVVSQDIVLTAVYEMDLHVNYDPGEHGTIVVNDYVKEKDDTPGIYYEIVRENHCPVAPTVIPDENYVLTGFVADKDLITTDGATLAAGEVFSAEVLTSVAITEEITVTAVYKPLYKATYLADDHGTFIVGDTVELELSEILMSGETPTYGGDTIPAITVEPAYRLTGFICDTDVVLDGETITAGTLINEEDINRIVVTSDLEFTAFYIYQAVVPTGVNVDASGLGVIVPILALGGIVLLVRKKKLSDN